MAAALLAAVACNAGGGAFTPTIHILHTEGAPAWVAVSGLPYADLKALEPVHDTAQLQAILSVRVDPGQPPIVGAYSVADGTFRFSPQFPLDPGRAYYARFDPAKLPRSAGRTNEAWRNTVVETELALPVTGATAPTGVKRLVPSGDAWPANQLRVYIEFTAPMSGRGGIEHLHLLDDAGQEVKDPFLPLDYDFWNADRTRFTAFFDPGRVKSGLVPRMQMGPSLQPGRHYTLVVDRDWHDGWGQPLDKEYRREFHTVAADTTPISLAAWTLTVPKAGTTDPVTVAFGEPLDRALMLRALAVRPAGMPVLPGDAKAGEADRSWTFEPEMRWKPGRYELVASSVLEDLAGNQIGRAFEVDTFRKVESTEPTITSRTFEIK